jgi:hypothetical protein
MVCDLCALALRLSGSYTGITGVGTLANLTVTSAISGSVTGNAGTVSTINGLLAQGTNITISGTGTSGSPYTINSSGGGGGSATTKSITQTAHGFSVQQVLKYNGTAYALAEADSNADQEVIGIVSTVTDANDFILTTNGYVTGLSGLTAGTTYFLSATSPGTLTATEPTMIGQVSKPLLVADSTTSGYFTNYRGMVVGGAAASLLGAANTWTASQTYSGGIYQSAGAAEEAVYPNGNSGTSATVAWDNGNLQSITITGAVALAFTAPTHPGKFMLVVTQDGTGHVYSLPTIKWPGGTPPTLSTAANAIDVISVVWTGSYYLGVANTAFA